MVAIRFEGSDLAELPCAARYDPALCAKGGNRVLVVKKIEVLKNGDVWLPYPTVTWLDSVEHEGQLVTRVLVKKTDEEGFDLMASPDGVPDGILMEAAKAAGIFTQYIG
jgi:hypothetical protein